MTYSRKQYDWDSNPPQDFIKWWATQESDVKPVVAWNCQSYRDQWTEAVASVSPDN